MIIKDKTIDGGKGFAWGKVSSEYAKYRDILHIQKNFIKKFLIWDCAETDKWFWISVQELEFCQETYILMEQSGLVQIFQKNRFSKHENYLKE